jgi:drug/metabolite transporter (DMT)-like permease
MIRKRQIEIFITAVFIVCILLIFFYGFKYFAGFQYATPFDQLIISSLGIIFSLCLIYFVYRFLEWVIKKIRKNSSIR